MQRLQCGHLGAPEQVVKPAEPFVPGFLRHWPKSDVVRMNALRAEEREL